MESEDYGVPPGADGGQSALPRTIVATGERVAVVETKVSGLQEDMRRIGTHIHAISNEVTKIGISEQKCLEALTGLHASVERFETKLIALVEDSMRRQGLSAFVQRFCLIVAAGAGLVAIFGYMASHVGLK